MSNTPTSSHPTSVSSTPTSEPSSVSPNSSPAFQFYPRDLLTDEHWIAMSSIERGIYWHLVSLCWIEGSLPTDQHLLARMCSEDYTTFKRAWPRIVKCFRPRGNNRLIHPRLERERGKQNSYRENARKAGQASAVARKKIAADNARSTPVEPTLNEPNTLQSLSLSSTKRVRTHTVDSAKAAKKKTAQQQNETRFARWYAIYPVKKAKRDAQKAFRTLDPDDALTDRMISAVEHQRRKSESALSAGHWTERWPNPPAWIRGRRREDAG